MRNPVARFSTDGLVLMSKFFDHHGVEGALKFSMKLSAFFN